MHAGSIAGTALPDFLPGGNRHPSRPQARLPRALLAEQLPPRAARRSRRYASANSCRLVFAQAYMMPSEPHVAALQCV
jgi:hypothetical protein